ncbi:unnamed protein product [Phaedon cochleariae]|uniref:Ubiquitin-like modifier-activating enzyme ATG7 n=1 Tax=Phaedon cochleariae TaxID=80249 RepID=A0A9N9X148_PHACE|nr:unnamed protein product [Phaedon cochleariae]
MTTLSYVQLSSSINPSFWNKLSELKLDVFKLNEDGKDIWGYFPITVLIVSSTNCATPFLEVDSTSFNSEVNGQLTYLKFHGKLYNKNTLEQFKECNKMELINGVGQSITEQIISGKALCDPSILNTFLLLSFADLKKYHYYYWFGFPVPKGLVIEKIASSPIIEEFSLELAEKIHNGYKQLAINQRCYFLVIKGKSGLEVYTLAEKLKDINLEDIPEVYFVFHNISSVSSSIGSQLRNYVTLLLHECKFLANEQVNFIAFHLSREKSRITCLDSICYKLKLPAVADSTLTSEWVGWEKNERGKMGPKLANLKNSLDPLIISENAVDLNLKLMKWNLVPSIDLDKLKNTKCLLLGSGTLGCSVARTLLGWGVRNITFVDNSAVSYSNPVRQSLYTYQDSVEMKPKADAAAENIRKIFPGVNSIGYQMTIPMPGHTVGDSMVNQTKETVEKLIQLIESHDVIFLLMDSRESRWLPTLLANAQQKVVLNAALGFDSYLVMRHGIYVENATEQSMEHPEGYRVIDGANLGCYFCNDVTAPCNSMKNRTLDQQCTVTRPGVSQIAGSLAVELAVSLIQHKDGVHAPAFYTTSQNVSSQDLSDINPSNLGLVPHSIRGFLSSFEQFLPATQKYKNCVACSDMIIQEYKEKGMEFLLEVFNSSKHLEDVALLTEMLKETDFGEVLEFSDEDFCSQSSQ